MNFTDRTAIVSRVQSALGLTPDGIDGPLTWTAIANRIAPTPVSPPTAPSTLDPKLVLSTLDSRTEKHLLSLDPKAVAPFRRFILAAKAIAAQHGCEYVAISGNRTWAEQDALYAKGRTTAGPKVTNARGGQSNHNFGIAMDFGVFRAGQYLDDTDPKTAAAIHKAVSAAAKAEGLDWGGGWVTFPDIPHFEIRTGLTIAEKRDRYARTGSVL